MDRCSQSSGVPHRQPKRFTAILSGSLAWIAGFGGLAGGALGGAIGVCGFDDASDQQAGQ